MTSLEFIKGHWGNKVSYIMVLSLLCLWAIILIRKSNSEPKHWLRFIIGGILLTLALCSPVSYLSHGYLFFAHMITHVTILMILPAIFWTSLPDRNDQFRTSSVFHKPIFSWISFLFIMWIMHLPWMVNTMMGATDFSKNHQNLVMYSHVICMMLSIIIGVWFYFPVLAPRPYPRLSPLASVAYLVTGCMGCSLLGISITFAPNLLYKSFLPSQQNPEILNLIQNIWMITPESDQQIAGLIMWVPGCLIYLSITLSIFLKWFISYNSDKND